MSIRIAHHRKVSHDPTYVHRRLNQNVLLTCQLSNSIYFFTAVALKTEVIEASFHFILHDDQNEDWIVSPRSYRTRPDVVATFKPAITDNRKTAERGVELDRSVKIARVDCDVGPAWRHGSDGAPTSLSAVREHPARALNNKKRAECRRTAGRMPALHSLLGRQLTIQLHDLKRHISRGVHVFHVQPFLDGVNRAHARAEVRAFDTSAIENVCVTTAAGRHGLDVEAHARCCFDY